MVLCECGNEQGKAGERWESVRGGDARPPQGEYDGGGVGGAGGRMRREM